MKRTGIDVKYHGRTVKGQKGEQHQIKKANENKGNQKKWQDVKCNETKRT
jgi:hypothetical protein